MSTGKKSGGQKAVKEALGAATGAALGAVVGGPVGAVAGSAAGPLAVYLIEMGSERMARMGRILSRAASFSGKNDGEFAHLLSSNARLSDLTHEVLRSSSSASFTSKADALAALIANASLESRDLEKYFLLTKILDALTQPHIDVLTFVVKETETSPETQLTPEQIMSNFPDYSPIIRSVVRTLELHGLIVDQGTGRHSDGTESVLWRPSPVGVTIVELLTKVNGLQK